MVNILQKSFWSAFFFSEKNWYYDSDFTKGPINNEPLMTIGLGNGLVPNKCQSITWTSDGPMIDYNRSSVGSLQILMIDYGNAIID